MAKEKETENRSERERFLDCMLKEILSGRRNPGDRLPTESELAEQYGLRKTNVHLGLQELERLGFLKVVPRHATYVAPYWEQANLETLAAIMTHGGKPQPELVDAFLELREMVALGWFRWTGRNPKTEQMRHLYGLLERMEAIAYAPDGEKDNPKFLDLVNQFLVCMFAESDNMIFRVLLRSSRELAHVTYYIVAYTLDTQELCKTYRTVLDGLTSGHASEAIDYWCGGATGSRCSTARRCCSSEANDPCFLPRRDECPAGVKALFVNFSRRGCARRALVLKSGKENRKGASP